MISPALRSAIRDAAPYLAAMRKVVPIRTDVKVRTWSCPRSEKKLAALAKRHRLEGPVRRLREALAGEGNGRTAKREVFEG